MVNIDPGEVKKANRKCKIGDFVGGRFDRRAEEQTRQNTRKSLEIQVECLPDCTIFKLNSKVISLLCGNPEHLILEKNQKSNQNHRIYYSSLANWSVQLSNRSLKSVLVS